MWYLGSNKKSHYNIIWHQPKQCISKSVKINKHLLLLVGGFNPSEKYQSNWIISPGSGENKNIRNHQLVLVWFPPYGSHMVPFHESWRPLFQEEARCTCCRYAWPRRPHRKRNTPKKTERFFTETSDRPGCGGLQNANWKTNASLNSGRKKGSPPKKRTTLKCQVNDD